MDQENKKVAKKHYLVEMYGLLGDMHILCLPGIEASVAIKLAETLRFEKAFIVLNIFATHYRDDYERFRDWMSDLIPVTDKQIHDCFDLLEMWCCEHSIKRKN